MPLAGEFTDWQIKRAAKLTQRLIDFKVRIDRCVQRSLLPLAQSLTSLCTPCSQEILPDSSRAGPFDMHQYTRCVSLSSSRYPS